MSEAAVDPVDPSELEPRVVSALKTCYDPEIPVDIYELGLIYGVDIDPTGFVGARVPAWGGNLRRGKDEVYVVEADEYDRSFHQLLPNIAVVTTLEADHLDIYGSLEAVEEAFLIFAESVPDDGMIACCADDHGAARLANVLRGGPERVMTYGLNAGSMLRAEEVDLAGGGARFTVRERGKVLGTASLRAPGASDY